MESICRIRHLCFIIINNLVFLSDFVNRSDQILVSSEMFVVCLAKANVLPVGFKDLNCQVLLQRLRDLPAEASCFHKSRLRNVAWFKAIELFEYMFIPIRVSLDE